jgi:hypothetical protein
MRGKFKPACPLGGLRAGFLPLPAVSFRFPKIRESFAAMISAFLFQAKGLFAACRGLGGALFRFFASGVFAKSPMGPKALKAPKP